MKISKILNDTVFYSQLSPSHQEKFKKAFVKKLQCHFKDKDPETLLDDIEVTQTNLHEIEMCLKATISFSFFGLIFGSLWAAYHRIPYALVSILILLGGSFLVLGLTGGDVKSLVASKGYFFPLFLGIMFGARGRGWVIADQFVTAARLKHNIDAKPVAIWPYLGLQSEKPWIRVFVCFLFTLILKAGLYSYHVKVMKSPFHPGTFLSKEKPHLKESSENAAPQSPS